MKKFVAIRLPRSKMAIAFLSGNVAAVADARQILPMPAEVEARQKTAAEVKRLPVKPKFSVVEEVEG